LLDCYFNIRFFKHRMKKRKILFYLCVKKHIDMSLITEKRNIQQLKKQ
tara:strand:- start:1472 stop:1615 length:144 start_codon:yes stop_codon:yes gene_type:complete